MRACKSASWPFFIYRYNPVHWIQGQCQRYWPCLSQPWAQQLIYISVSQLWTSTCRRQQSRVFCRVLGAWGEVTDQFWDGPQFSCNLGKSENNVCHLRLYFTASTVASHLVRSGLGIEAEQSPVHWQCKQWVSKVRLIYFFLGFAEALGVACGLGFGVVGGKTLTALAPGDETLVASSVWACGPESEKKATHLSFDSRFKQPKTCLDVIQNENYPLA